MLAKLISISLYCFESINIVAYHLENFCRLIRNEFDRIFVNEGTMPTRQVDLSIGVIYDEDLQQSCRCWII